MEGILSYEEFQEKLGKLADRYDSTDIKKRLLECAYNTIVNTCVSTAKLRREPNNDNIAAEAGSALTVGYGIQNVVRHVLGIDELSLEAWTDFINHATSANYDYILQMIDEVKNEQKDKKND